MPELYVHSHRQDAHVIILLDDSTQYGVVLRKVLFNINQAGAQVLRSASSNRRYSARSIFSGLPLPPAGTPVFPEHLVVWKHDTASLEAFWRSYNLPTLPPIIIRVRYPDALQNLINLFSLGSYVQDILALKEPVSKQELTDALVAFLSELSSFTITEV